MYKEDYRDTPPSRRFIFQNQQQTDRPQEEEGFIRAPSFRRSSTPRYQTIFLVYVMHVIILDIKL
jgi:hypothetical protein